MNQYDHKQFKFTPATLAIPLYSVFFLWLVYWFEVKFGYNFNKYGVAPRTIIGLRGVLFSPFIHSGIQHLFSNSVPLFVLLISLFYFYKDIAFKIVFYGLVLSGVLTWTIARPSYHIGASGIVYLLFSFIFFSGIIRKYNRLVAVSLMVIFLYGGMIWYIFPIKEEISWEGHLSGFIVGLLFAVTYRNRGPQKMIYTWENENYVDEVDIFLDEEGNFIDLNEEKED
ncbi:MAG: rhomboid family intramembrane serine protease [Flavobacteriaceae bacterium]|nr:rhomboid family intramembrane serine protease [Flavobacteriaceae bacterium]